MIYLCIPAHNEEQTVGVVLWKIRQVMAELQRDYQLLVADDGSTDRTSEVLEPYTRVLPLTVFRTTTRRGYANTLEMLVREAVARSDYPRRDTVITLQADFTDEPGHVETLIKRIESGADIVASNTLPLRSGPRIVRWHRPILNALVRKLGWPEEIRDPLSGFNAFRVFCIRKAMDGRQDGRLIRSDGWAANAELLHLATPHARRIDGVDIQPHPERRQRDSRFLFMPAFRQVMDLRRGRSATTATVESLRPDSIAGGPSNRRSLVAESLREESARARGRNGDPQRARNGRRRSERGPEERPARPRERGSRDAQSTEGRPPRRGAAAGGPARTRGERQQRERPPRQRQAEPTAGRERRRQGNGGSTSEPSIVPPDVLDQAAPESGVAQPESERPKRRSRRGRRGSGRSRAGEPVELQGIEADNTSQGDAAAAPETASPPPEATGGPDQESPTGQSSPDSNASAEAMPRRRRSRRGGRGRKRRGVTQNGEPQAEPANMPPDLDPPFEENTPKAS